MELRGTQPARAALRRERYTTRQAADAISVSYTHLANVLGGKVRPCPEVRERLPKLLGVPLEELFDAVLLERPYDDVRGKGAAL